MKRQSGVHLIAFADPDRLADAIIERVGKRIVLALPLGLGKANHVANALFARAAADPSVRLRIFTALTFEVPRGRPGLERRFVAPLAERVFAGYPNLDYAVAQRQGRLPPNIEVDEFFFQAGTRLGVSSAQQSYISANYTHALRYVMERGVNVVAQLVARRSDSEGESYSLSCNPDLTRDLLSYRARGEADFLFVGQVNSELPFMPGDAELASGDIDWLLRSEATEFALFAPPREPVDVADYAAALHVARTIVDGGTLQLGIGSLGDAVTQALILRQRHNAEFCSLVKRLDPDERAPPGLRESAPFTIGLHGLSEMFVEGFLDLIRAGILTREVDGTLLDAAFFVGSRGFYRALREMPQAELAKLRMTSVSFVNQLYGDEAAKRRARINARFINNAMMATLLGDVVSDALEDGQVVSGVGGQFNFVAQGFALDDARSVIVLPATRTVSGRTTSNVRWNYGHTTIPRHLRDIVVTEYGIADLRGKGDRDVIAAMLAVADSRFQDDLLSRAKEAGKIPRDYQLPPACCENRPERIKEALAPARAQGLLPPFPFGTDFTPIEQRLIPALRLLVSASMLDRARLALQGAWPLPGSAEQHACLSRMGLDKPSGAVDRIHAALLRGALAATTDLQS